MEADFQQEEQQRKQRTVKVNQLQSKLDANNKLFWLLNDSFNDDDLAYEIDVINNERYVCLTFATCGNLISNIRRI